MANIKCSKNLSKKIRKMALDNVLLQSCEDKYYDVWQRVRFNNRKRKRQEKMNTSLLRTQTRIKLFQTSLTSAECTSKYNLSWTDDERKNIENDNVVVITKEIQCLEQIETEEENDDDDKDKKFQWISIFRNRWILSSSPSINKPPIFYKLERSEFLSFLLQQILYADSLIVSLIWDYLETPQSCLVDAWYFNQGLQTVNRPLSLLIDDCKTNGFSYKTLRKAMEQHVLDYFDIAYHVPSTGMEKEVVPIIKYKYRRFSIEDEYHCEIHSDYFLPNWIIYISCILLLPGKLAFDWSEYDQKPMGKKIQIKDFCITKKRSGCFPVYLLFCTQETHFGHISD